MNDEKLNEVINDLYKKIEDGTMEQNSIELFTYMWLAELRDRRLEEENISDFADYLIENASYAFEQQDRELLEKVLRDYKKIRLMLRKGVEHMKYVKCDNECQMSDHVIDKNICCYWCNEKAECDNPCSNLDCKVVKEIELEDED